MMDQGVNADSLCIRPVTFTSGYAQGLLDLSCRYYRIGHTLFL